jgi:hypothetical protein
MNRSLQGRNESPGARLDQPSRGGSRYELLARRERARIRSVKRQAMRKLSSGPVLHFQTGDEAKVLDISSNQKRLIGQRNTGDQ